MRIGRWFSGEWIKEKVQSSEEYRVAIRFAHEYQPQPGKDYGWVLTHALKDFDSAIGRIDVLESKADSLIGYLGAGSGLVALASIYSNKLVFGYEVLASSIPTLLFMLLAMVCAAIARTPAKLPSLPETREALVCANENTEIAEGRFAAMISTSSVAASLAAREKAKFVRAAFWLFVVAMIWLVGFVILMNLPRLKALIFP